MMIKFWDKYEVDEEFGESGYLDKTPETLRKVHKYWLTEPNKIWSVYQSGHIVCGYHFIDVAGYIITKNSGNCGEEFFNSKLSEMGN